MSDSSLGDVETLRVYHDQTANSAGEDRDGSRLVRDFTSQDRENWPDPFKRYPHAETVVLPADLPDTAASAAEVLSGTAQVSPEPYDLARLARLLFFMDGVTRAHDRKDLGVRMYMRAAPSAGNLHPIDLYMVTGGLSDLEAGVYHFAPLAFALERLRSGDYRGVVASALDESALAGSPLFLILTGIPFRTGWKYAERGFRHIYWDAGTMLANALAMTEASGWPASIAMGFVDVALQQLLDLDGVEEFPVAVVRLGGEGAPTRGTPDLEPSGLDSTAIAPRPIEFPLVTAAQHASDLPDPAAVAGWRERAVSFSMPAGARALKPPAAASSETLDEVILRRGSTRMMRPATVPRELFDWPMSAATRPIDSDFTRATSPAQGTTLLQHVVSIHAVEGVEPGVYRLEAGRLVPMVSGTEEEIRRLSRRLCLVQPLGGDSGYTVFHCTRIEELLGRAGARSYRAANLEAGIVAGRLGLAAFTLGFGATELTFFDDEVRELTGLDCLLVTSVGVPAYRNRRGGPPGRPSELVGMSALSRRQMEQLEAAEQAEADESQSR